MICIIFIYIIRTIEFDHSAPMLYVNSTYASDPPSSMRHLSLTLEHPGGPLPLKTLILSWHLRFHYCFLTQPHHEIIDHYKIESKILESEETQKRIGRLKEEPRRNLVLLYKECDHHFDVCLHTRVYLLLEQTIRLRRRTCGCLHGVKTESRDN